MLRRDQTVALSSGEAIGTDAAGEPCVINRASAALPSALPSKARAGLSATRTARRAWRDNPICIECGKPVQNAENCGLVTLADATHRVAHRTRCFVRALLGANPTITTADCVSARTH
jgi:hypothetical protein